MNKKPYKFPPSDMRFKQTLGADRTETAGVAQEYFLQTKTKNIFIGWYWSLQFKIYRNKLGRSWFCCTRYKCTTHSLHCHLNQIVPRTETKGGI